MDESIDKTKKSNIYDKLLIGFIALQAFGQFGGVIQPIRVFVIICMPFVFVFFLRNKGITYKNRYELLLFVFWTIYGTITLLWAIIPSESIKEILYLILNFFAFFTVVFFANKSLKPQESIMKGWLLLFLLTFPIAIYELMFDIHLPTATQDEGMIMNYANNIFERSFASVTYGNLNEYNLLLCYMFPFILGFLLMEGSKLKKLFIWVVVICLSYVIIMNGSRGAVLSSLIGLFVFMFYYIKKNKSIWILIAAVFGVLFLAVIYSQEIFAVIIGRFTEQGLSDDGRSEILTQGLLAFLGTGFFGLGAGNFIPTMVNIYHIELGAAHNLFLEIGAQYGLIILLLFMGMFFRLYKKQKINPNNSYKYIVIASLCMLPITSTIDSGYILGAWVWMFLGSLFIIADNQYNFDSGL
jgi:teichuronic acid biosynthesis protein TuaE